MIANIKEEIKLSIIIPYFETYELTEKLLKELAIQATNNIEILVYDDGCEEDRLNQFNDLNRITIKKQENKGVAKTRNRGIKEARGKYIAFIDCDDMITMDYVDTLLKAIDTYDNDVINFNWYDMTTHEEHRKPHNPAPWKQIYKKETIPRFREDKLYGSEDVDWQKEINKKRADIIYLDKLLYFYNSNREGSLFWKSKHEEN